MRNNFFKQNLLPIISLFTSFSTLLCCALPALLVALGFGAALSGLISAAPWVAAIASHKLEVFVLAGVILLLAGFIHWRARHASCPIDEQQASVCRCWRRVNSWVLFISVTLYVIGFFVAFLAADIFY